MLAEHALGCFRFRSGEFVMIGLPKEDGKPLLRAYSVASPSYDEELEFQREDVRRSPGMMIEDEGRAVQDAKRAVGPAISLS